MKWLTSTFAQLNQPVASVVGEKTAKKLEPLGVRTVTDLLHHVPRRYLLGTENSDLSNLPIGDDVALVARVHKMEVAGQAPRRRLEVQLTDGTGFLDVTFFGKDYLLEYWQKQLSMSNRGIFVGKVGSFRDQPQLTHPLFVMIDAHGTVVGKADKAEMVRQVSRSGLVGLYPTRGKLATWTIGATIDFVLDALDLVEPLPQWVIDEADLPTLPEAFDLVHRGHTRADAERGLGRLRFDEALGLQLAMAQRRADNAHHRAAALTGRPGGLLDQFDARLPFSLTRGQQQVSTEIFNELAAERPMQRLLQGEVGSGKTLVALRAMLRTVDSGHQAALLAPTEVLASQHAHTIRLLLGDLGQGPVLGAPADATDVVLLTGSMPAAARRAALAKVSSGEAGIVVGTHALLGEGVRFDDLGLVVVDEQHRFGVEQRAALAEKATLRPHVLVMTATPIPRSVAMTVFGDLETSQLTEIPAGRSEVQTTVVDVAAHPTWVSRAWQRIGEEAARGRQAFVVCPAISGQTSDDTELWFDDGETPQLTTVEDLADELRQGPLQHLRLGALHGKLPAAEKDAVMRDFAAGELDVLVSTTVVEVGVDVPNATVMVIMDADRFGISQLHQLRGRVGRGRHPGLCLLVTRAHWGTPARERLAAVEATRDGFELAEADLAARREGNVLGATQSGTRSAVKLLQVAHHAELIQQARHVAQRLIEQHPDHPGVRDIIAQTELLAAGDWLEKN